MMKHSTVARATALSAAAAFMFAGVSTLSAADTASAKPASTQPAPAKAAPKTLAEAFAFLPDTIAEVGSKKISKQDFLKQLGNVPVEYVTQLPPEMLKAQAKQMINAMAEMELLLDLAKKSGIQPSKEMVIAELDKEFKNLPKEQRDLIEKQLKVQGKTFED
ncbi:MAG: SurA N-terminal domain-containing protein, partial [Lentisphaeria bacterium]|nr:SurA N-terminal domain-containing protein [Lentisphaeria bacterium]